MRDFRRTPSLLLVSQNSSSALVDVGGGVDVVVDVGVLVAVVSGDNKLVVAVDTEGLT
jgi:hypothetical protein